MIRERDWIKDNFKEKMRKYIAFNDKAIVDNEIICHKVYYLANLSGLISIPNCYTGNIYFNVLFLQFKKL